MINERLFDWYGIDTKKHLNIKTFCTRPFDTVLIDKQGNCFICECASWLPQSVGNLHHQSFEEVVESKKTKILQDSILDNSYRFCNDKQCSYLMYQKNNKRTPWEDVAPVVQIKNIRLAIDDSCNLRCPSCRKGLIFFKEGKEFQRRIKLADTINNWLNAVEHPVKVHVGADGDPFASHVYRHFMKNTPAKKHIKYSLLTNGLLFKEFVQDVPHITENLQELGVSIDGASKETYENLRLGGSWQKINDNLKYIQKLKKKHNFVFRLHFVVQKENFHEMEKIIELGKRYDADNVWLNKIENWNVMNNFEEQDIFQSESYQNCLQKIKKILQTQNKKFVECPTLID